MEINLDKYKFDKTAVPATTDSASSPPVDTSVDLSKYKVSQDVSKYQVAETPSTSGDGLFSRVDNNNKVLEETASKDNWWLRAGKDKIKNVINVPNDASWLAKTGGVAINTLPWIGQLGGKAVAKGSEALTSVAGAVALPFTKTASTLVGGAETLMGNELTDEDIANLPEWLKPYNTKREAMGGALQIGATLLPGTAEAKALMATQGLSWIKGAKIGAATGLVGGAGVGLEKAGKENMNLADTAKEMALSGIGGAAVGAVGGAVAGAGSDLWQGKNPITGKEIYNLTPHSQLQVAEDNIDKAFGTKKVAKAELKGTEKANAMNEEYMRPQRFLAEEGVIPTNTKQGTNGKVWDTSSEMDTLKNRVSLGAKAIADKMDEVNPSATNSFLDAKNKAVTDAMASTKNAEAAQKMGEKVSVSFDVEIKKALAQPETMVEMTKAVKMPNGTTEEVINYVSPSKVNEMTSGGFKMTDVFVKDSYMNNVKQGFYEQGAYETMPDGRAAYRAAGSSLRKNLESRWTAEGMDLRTANKVLEQYYDALGFLKDMNGASVPKAGNGIVKKLVQVSADMAGRSSGVWGIGRAMGYGTGELYDQLAPDAAMKMANITAEGLADNPNYAKMMEKLGLDFSKLTQERGSRLMLPEAPIITPPPTDTSGTVPESEKTYVGRYAKAPSATRAEAISAKNFTGKTPVSGQFQIDENTKFSFGRDGNWYMKNPYDVPTLLNEAEANELMRAGYISQNMKK